jgi:quinoprotein glucose dehydrogenase
MTLDADRGLLYMPVAGPSANYWGGDRPGNNLFANSIVAVDAETGRYRWHFQTVHHDLWDSDMPNPPVLVDIQQGGRRVPALASVGKTGWMFILDRVTGKPIFGVEERPVPKGSVPGEWYSPTQPPVKPARPLVRVDFVKNGTWCAPGHVRAARGRVRSSVGEERRLRQRGSVYPVRLSGGKRAAEEHDPVSGRHRRRELGRRGGRSDDRLRVRDRARHLARRLDRGETSGAELRQRRGGNEDAMRPRQRERRRSASRSARHKDATGRTLANLPCQRPPGARLVAVERQYRRHRWETLGLTEALPEGKQLTGNSGSAGPTVTAGGLVFVGATTDRRMLRVRCQDRGSCGRRASMPR